MKARNHTMKVLLKRLILSNKLKKEIWFKRWKRKHKLMAIQAIKIETPLEISD